MKYWTGNGKYRAEADTLKPLVGRSGKCDTLAGELYRAASAIYYEAYNNNFINNRSGAYNFLKAKMPQYVTSPLFSVAMDTIEPLVNPPSDLSISPVNTIDLALDTIMDFTIATACKLIDVPNTEDMLDYEDEDAHEDKYFDEEDEWLDNYGDEDRITGR